MSMALRLADLEVVLGLEALGSEVAGCADRLDHDEVVLTSARDVASMAEHERVGRPRSWYEPGLLLLLGPSLRDQRAELLLLCPQPLEGCDRTCDGSRRPTGLVDQRRRLAAPPEHDETVRVGAQQPESITRHSLPTLAPAPALFRARAARVRWRSTHWRHEGARRRLTCWWSSHRGVVVLWTLWRLLGVVDPLDRVLLRGYIRPGRHWNRPRGRRADHPPSVMS